MSHTEDTYLELSDPSKNSHKFYEITIEENKIVTRYGRIGDQGRSITKTYSSPEDAKQTAQKKIQEKLRKGYEHAITGERKKKPIETLKKPPKGISLIGCSTLEQFERLRKITGLNFEILG